jgi:mRNA-degrading endonuclease RelE of RelBE toxin-antitoxin system
MVWRVEFAKGAQKDLAKLDASGRERVLRFLAERVELSDDPRKLGGAERTGCKSVLEVPRRRLSDHL